MTQRFLAGILMAFGVLAAAHAGPAVAKPPTNFNPVVEAENFSITEQRQTIYDTPEYQAELQPTGPRAPSKRSPNRPRTPNGSSPTTSAGTAANGCAGDVRLYNWEKDGYGIVRQVLFTARGGATISGRVWATAGGPPSVRES